MLEALTMPRKALHFRNQVEALPLFAWMMAAKSRGGRPRTGSQPAKHCKTCGVKISRYSRGHCRSCGYIGLKRCCPDDFLAVLHRLGSQGAAKHFNASLSTVTRWRREAGMVLHERARRSNPKASSFLRSRGFISADRGPQRDMTSAGQAADFLRRFGAVYRCDAKGKPDAKGSHWKRNFSVLTDEEIVRKAQRLGWAPVALCTASATDDLGPESMSVATLCRREALKAPVVAAMVASGNIDAVLRGDGWSMAITAQDARMIVRAPDCTFVDRSAALDLINSGWEPRPERLKAMEA